MKVLKAKKSVSVKFYMRKSRPNEGSSREYIQRVPENTRLLRIRDDAWGLRILIDYEVELRDGRKKVTAWSCLRSSFIYYGGQSFSAEQLRLELQKELPRSRKQLLSVALEGIEQRQKLEWLHSNGSSLDGDAFITWLKEKVLAGEAQPFAVEIGPNTFEIAASDELWLPADQDRTVDLTKLRARIHLSQEY